MAKIVVFDGNSILNRAYYGIRPLSTADGIPTNAVYGFINIILKNLKMCEDAIYGAVAFDLKAPTFRHKMYESYKANRHGMPDDLAAQLPYAKQAAEFLGLKVLEKEGYEADDILGTLAKDACGEGFECVIVTGDKDSLQLINDCTTVYLAATNETKIFDRAAFNEKYGIQPEVFVDVKALMGDSSDNIPGVKGIGEKGALKLISEHGSLKGVYDAADGIKGSVGEKLRADRENAFLSLELAKIYKDVPLSVKVSDCLIERKDKELLELCRRLELSGIAERLKLRVDESAPTVKKEEFKEMQSKSAHKSFESAEKVYIYVCDNAVFATDGKGTNLRFELDTESEEFFGAVEKRAVFWSYKEAGEKCAPLGFEIKSPLADISLLAYIVKPFEGGQSSPVKAAKAIGLFDGEKDAEAETLMLPALEEALVSAAAEAGQLQLYRTELKLSALLLEMEKTGFKVDRQGLVEYSAFLSERMAEAEEAIFALAGEEFNINSPKQLSVILFEKLGLPHFKKTQSGYSTDADVMQKLRRHHPIIDLILSYRQFSKLKSTYADGLVKVISEKDGRIHSTFKQTLTMTGRLSSTEPNLQNIPVRTDLGKVFRKFFVADEGMVLIDADYSQIELRVLAHLSGDENLIGAFRDGEDVHSTTAAAVFGVPRTAVSEELRKRAKAVNFGVVYGISAFSLAEDIGVSRKEAQDYIDAYFKKHPAIRDYLDATVKKGKADGYVSTIFGRRRYIPELSAKNKNLQAFGERVAMNTPIQGAAADIIKKAMVDTDAALKAANLKARLILQIHDELIVEAPVDEAEKAAQILKEKMENTVKLLVPLVADAHVGKSWFDAK
ncbi:MAG: DNA polymerase I [Clostridia bacterium]|nr:DNA polymerase I [Clostridia bacterium]